MINGSESKSDEAPLLELEPEPELDPPEDDELESGMGFAMGVVGAYVTPFRLAATWKTDPPPYS